MHSTVLTSSMMDTVSILLSQCAEMHRCSSNSSKAVEQLQLAKENVIAARKERDLARKDAEAKAARIKELEGEAAKAKELEVESAKIRAKAEQEVKVRAGQEQTIEALQKEREEDKASIALLTQENAKKGQDLVIAVRRVAKMGRLYKSRILSAVQQQWPDLDEKLYESVPFPTFAEAAETPLSSPDEEIPASEAPAGGDASVA